MDQPIKKYVLLHESRQGLKLHRFESQRDLSRMRMLGMSFPSDLDGDRRDLLRFLGITLAADDYAVIVVEPDSKGVW